MWRLCLSSLFNKLHPYPLDPLESWKLRAIRYVKPTNLVEVLFIFVLFLIQVMTHKQWSREKTVGLYYECSEAPRSHSEWLLSWVSTSLGGAWQQETVTGWAQSHHTYVPPPVRIWSRWWICLHLYVIRDIDMIHCQLHWWQISHLHNWYPVLYTF